MAVKTEGSELLMRTKPGSDEVFDRFLFFCFTAASSEVVPVCAQLHGALGVLITRAAVQRMFNLQDKEKVDLLTATRVIAKQQVTSHLNASYFGNNRRGQCAFTESVPVETFKPSEWKQSIASCKTTFSCTGLSIFLQCNKSVVSLVLLNVLGPVSLTAQSLRGIAPWWWKANRNIQINEIWINNQLLSFKRWWQSAGRVQYTCTIS